MPTDLARDTAEWQKISSEVCPPGSKLTREEMQHIGLLLNTELNQARIRLRTTTSAAEYAGLWEDPSLSGSLERVVQKKLTNGGGGLGLTLPVTGLPALSKKIAEQYAESDYWMLADKERGFLEKLDILRYNLLVTRVKRDLTSSRLKVLRDEQQKLTRLHELGEIDFASFQVATQRLNDTVKSLQELENEFLNLNHDLIAMLGLHPASCEISPAGSLPSGVPAHVSACSPTALLYHPAIMSMQAAYGASETELQKEVRKQYPELGISPSYANDDSNDKLMLGLSVSIPLWNRNREAIARSTGNRELKQAELIATWRQMVQQSSALEHQQSLLRRHCSSEYKRLSELREATKQQEKLFEIGETNMLQLSEARHVAYERHLAYLECLFKLLENQTHIHYLSPYGIMLKGLNSASH